MKSIKQKAMLLLLLVATMFLTAQASAKPYLNASQLAEQGLEMVSEIYTEDYWSPQFNDSYDSINLTICNVSENGFPMFHNGESVFFESNLTKCDPGDDYPSAHIILDPGQFDGIKFLFPGINISAELELEYMPVSYQTGEFDLKWKSDPYIDEDKLYLLSGSGNIIREVIDFEQFNPDLDGSVVVGLGNGFTGVASLEVFTQAWRCPRTGCPGTGRYNYLKGNIKGVGYQDLSLQFEPPSEDSTAFIDTYDKAEHVQFNTEVKARDGVIETNLNSNFIGIYTGMAPMAPEVNFTAFNYTMEIEVEYMPVSYQTGTYDQKWKIYPEYDGNKLEIISGSGNVIICRTELEEQSDDFSDPILVGIDNGMTGVFSNEVFTQAWKCPRTGCPDAGRYNYLKSSIKGVGAFVPFALQFEDPSYDSTAFIDTYDKAEHIQLNTEAKSMEGVVESNINSNVIGVYTGMAPLLPGINYTNELEVEYMPVSYQTGTFDQKWQIHPYYDGKELKILSGSGNVITNRLEVEEFNPDINSPMLVGMGPGLTGVFSNEIFTKAARCPYTALCSDPGRYGYIKTNIKGVGYQDLSLQFEDPSYDSTTFIDTYNYAEHLQLTTDSKSDDGYTESMVNSNVIGVYTGMAPLLSNVTYHHEAEFEYTPTAYQTGTYDQKFKIEPYFDGEKLKIFSGSGNIITNRINLTENDLHARNKMVGVGDFIGVFSNEETITPDNLIGNDKGVGYLNYYIQYAPDGYDDYMFVQTVSYAEHYQCANSYNGTSSIINSNIIGLVGESNPVLPNANLSMNLEFEYMPVSYQTGTYDQKWRIDPYFEGDDLYLLEGSGNIITNNVVFEEMNPDLDASVLVGLGESAIGVFNLETFTIAWRCPRTGCPDTGRYNRYTSAIKGVGYMRYKLQFEDPSYDSVAFIDTYNMSEHIQLNTEAKSRDGVIESNFNSNFIGVYTGVKPVNPWATPGSSNTFNYTNEIEVEYMPVSYQTGNYDQKWRVYPVFENNTLHIKSGSGNLITDRLEIDTDMDNDLTLAGLGPEMIGVFSIELFKQAWRCEEMGTLGSCDPSAPRYNYLKSSVKGVGYVDTNVTFVPGSYDSVAFIDTYNMSEHIQFTTESKARDGISEGNYNSNVIGMYTGMAPLNPWATPGSSNTFNYTNEIEVEYMPVSYQTGNYDQKWRVYPVFENNTLHIKSGSGNLITDRLEVEEFNPDINSPILVGLGPEMIGVFSNEIFTKAVRCPNALFCNDTGRYNYLKSSIKGVGYQNFTLQFEDPSYDSTTFIDTYNMAEHLQLTTDSKSDDGYTESMVNSNVIGVYTGMAPLLSNVTYHHEAEFEYMPTAYQTGSYDQKWKIDPYFDGEKLILESGTGNVITERIEINGSEMPIGLGGLIGVFSIEDYTERSVGNGYEKSSVKGVGAVNKTLYFADPADYGKTFLPTFSSAEMIQGTLEGSDSGSNWIVNIIGSYDGPKKLESFDLDNWTVNLELEYAPFMSCNNITYDQKWGSCLEETPESLRYICGTGIVVNLKGNDTSAQNILAIGGETFTGTNLSVNLSNIGGNQWSIGQLVPPFTQAAINTTFFYALDGLCTDDDADGICGVVDNCPSVYNPDQNDTDNDCIGDVCEITCPYYANADWTLTENLSCPATTIYANASDITIDCDGHSVNYSSLYTGYGFDVTGQSNVTIKNCIIMQTNESIDDSSSIVFDGYYDECANNRAENNTIYVLGAASSPSTASAGIEVRGTNSHDHAIINNTIHAESSRGSHGINIRGSAYDVLIKLNNVTSNLYSIFFHSCAENCNSIVEYNNASSASWAGVFVMAGKNNIIRSNIINNSNSGIGSWADNTTIVDNNITTFAGYGVYLSGNKHNNVSNNNITASGVNSLGINVHSGHLNNITSNNITIAGNQAIGINLNISNSSNILRNTIDSTGHGFGIDVQGSHNLVDENDISSGGNQVGIRVGGENNTLTNNIANLNDVGYYLHIAQGNNTLVNNTADSNSWNGFFIDGGENNFNNLTANRATNNAQGILISGQSSYNNLAGNIFSNNTDYGIVLADQDENNTIAGSTINNNGIAGILLDGNSNNNVLTGNSLMGNGNGIDIGSSSGNTITNTIVDNIIWDYNSFAGSLNNVVTNMTLAGTSRNTRVDFESKDVALRSASASDVGSLPDHYCSLNRWVNSTNNAGDSWIDLKLYYTDDDMLLCPGRQESNIKISRFKDSDWSHISTDVDKNINYGKGNISATKLDFAIFGLLVYKEPSEPSKPDVNLILSSYEICLGWEVNVTCNVTADCGNVDKVEMTANESINYICDKNGKNANCTGTYKPTIEGIHTIICTAEDTCSKTGKDTKQLDVSVCTNCSDLQAHPEGIGARISWLEATDEVSLEWDPDNLISSINDISGARLVGFQVRNASRCSGENCVSSQWSDLTNIDANMRMWNGVDNERLNFYNILALIELPGAAGGVCRPVWSDNECNGTSGWIDSCTKECLKH